MFSEVDIIQLLDDLAKNKDDNFNTIIKEIRTESLTNEFPIIPALAKKFQDRGIRMSRYYGSIRDDDAKVIKNLEKTK